MQPKFLVKKFSQKTLKMINFHRYFEKKTVHIQHTITELLWDVAKSDRTIRKFSKVSDPSFEHKIASRDFFGSEVPKQD